MGIQCYWSNDGNRCVWAAGNNITTVAYCTTPNEPFCYNTNYRVPDSSPKDSLTCIGPNNNIPLLDCSYAIPISPSNESPSDGSLCLGFVYDSCNNIFKQCQYRSDISKCDISSTKQPHEILCKISATRKYLGFSEDSSICSTVKPVNTNDGKTDVSKCLAYYTLPDKKPRLYNIYDSCGMGILDSCMTTPGTNGNNLMWFSIIKSWYDNSTHT